MLAVLLLTMAAFQNTGIGPVGSSTPRVTGSGPYPDRNGVTAPVAISKAEPAYPDDASAAGITGAVRLRCIVNEKGVPTDITVVKSLSPSLDQSAIDAVAKWRFKPGVKYGEPAPVQVLIDVTFHPR